MLRGGAGTTKGGHHRHPPSARGCNHQRRVGEILGGQLCGHTHTASQIERGKKHVGRLRQECGPLPLHGQGFTYQPVVGVIHQPPHHGPVSLHAGMRLETASPHHARQRPARLEAGSTQNVVCRGEPRRRHILESRAGPGSGQEDGCGSVAQHDHALDVSEQDRIRSPVPGGAGLCGAVAVRFGGDQLLRTRWANPSPHQLEDSCREANIAYGVPLWQPAPVSAQGKSGRVRFVSAPARRPIFARAPQGCTIRRWLLWATACRSLVAGTPVADLCPLRRWAALYAAGGVMNPAVRACERGRGCGRARHASPVVSLWQRFDGDFALRTATARAVSHNDSTM
ncbi:hypothetical protein SBRY_60488 [Actinacidiphila bryophytorum]|uniref:Uncharacterized protein n=1 Tax=Actinacidiphila bryophytorum TaxID=1436133 RepID=A0A9W4MK88_9ACTN|nr:hypothetical protein SBRY_60488 [Actinacidiphila bryophytorum]